MAKRNKWNEINRQKEKKKKTKYFFLCIDWESEVGDSRLSLIYFNVSVANAYKNANIAIQFCIRSIAQFLSLARSSHCDHYYDCLCELRLMFVNGQMEFFFVSFHFLFNRAVLPLLLRSLFFLFLFIIFHVVSSSDRSYFFFLSFPFCCVWEMWYRKQWRN